jgi:hypothetical protein
MLPATENQHNNKMKNIILPDKNVHKDTQVKDFHIIVCVMIV